VGQPVTGAGSDVRISLAAFAARPRVLLGTDFDGTLAPFVTDPMHARALPGGLEALRAAAALDGVTVAVVSGRDLATLGALTGIGPDDGIVLVGSHGAQTSLGNHATATSSQIGTFLDDAAHARLTALRHELEAIESRYPAVRLEHKPSAVVLHTRGVLPSVAAAATTAAHEVGGRRTGVHVLPGKDVVELTVLEANKGAALVDLARHYGSEATLYVGDDVTDERAFAALDAASGDLSVKVGNGETLAALRVPSPETVVELLELFVELRSART
jgi:trehalose 6-phosphate phosphatase